jgi:hypothetical protein
MCPGNEESAGKRRSGKTREGSKRRRSALTESAHAAARSKGTYLAAHYARLRGRRGSKKAAVAVGCSILVICYHAPERQVPYEELGEDYFDRRRSGEAHAKRSVRKLERLGHKVAREPSPQSAEEEAVTRPDFHTRLGASRKPAYGILHGSSLGSHPGRAVRPEAQPLDTTCCGVG